MSIIHWLYPYESFQIPFKITILDGQTSQEHRQVPPKARSVFTSQRRRHCVRSTEDPWEVTNINTY